MLVSDLSKLAHRQGLKRSLVGIGGLEVRERQRLALPLVCYLMVAHSKAQKHLKMPNNKKPSGNKFKSSGFMLAVNLVALADN